MANKSNVNLTEKKYETDGFLTAVDQIINVTVEVKKY